MPARDESAGVGVTTHAESVMGGPASESAPRARQQYSSVPDIEGPWDAAARDFHDANPQVMNELVGLCKRWREARPERPWGIGAAFEVLRWQRAMRTSDHLTDFKLNQNYRAWYAREIMRRSPELAGIFRTRQQAAA